MTWLLCFNLDNLEEFQNEKKKVNVHFVVLQRYYYKRIGKDLGDYLAVIETQR
jgi:hypothetical protein